MRTAKVLGILALVAALIAGVLFIRKGFALASMMFLEPMATKPLAVEAAGDGWTLAEFVDGGRSNHRYIFFRQGQRIDVTVEKDAQGKWITNRTPIDDSASR